MFLWLKAVFWNYSYELWWNAKYILLTKCCFSSKSIKIDFDSESFVNFHRQIGDHYEETFAQNTSNVFFTGQRANYFSSTGKNLYTGRDFLRSNSKSPVQRKIPIGILHLNSKSPVQWEIPIGIFRSNSKSSHIGIL